MEKPDWEIFREYVTWFPGPRESAVLQITNSSSGKLFVPTSKFRTRYPKLTKLLSRSRISTIDIDGEEFYLYTWPTFEGRRCGWLCEPPAITPPAILYADHRVLLECWGGGVESFNQPKKTWIMNLNWWLSGRKSGPLSTGEIADYRSYVAKTLRKPDCPFIQDLDFLINFAQEANGNFTAYNRSNGAVVMFAPDHCFKHVETVAECPPYSFYHIQGAPTLADWVEQTADQWLQNVTASE